MYAARGHAHCMRPPTSKCTVDSQRPELPCSACPPCFTACDLHTASSHSLEITCTKKTSSLSVPHFRPMIFSIPNCSISHKRWVSDCKPKSLSRTVPVSSLCFVCSTRQNWSTRHASRYCKTYGRPQLLLPPFWKTICKIHCILHHRRHYLDYGRSTSYCFR